MARRAPDLCDFHSWGQITLLNNTNAANTSSVQLSELLIVVTKAWAPSSLAAAYSPLHKHLFITTDRHFCRCCAARASCLAREGKRGAAVQLAAGVLPRRSAIKLARWDSMHEFCKRRRRRVRKLLAAPSRLTCSAAARGSTPRPQRPPRISRPAAGFEMRPPPRAGGARGTRAARPRRTGCTSPPTRSRR